MTEHTDRLAAVLAPVVEGVGLVLYDVELTGSGRARTLRVLVDREHIPGGPGDAPGGGGVDLDAVAAAAEALGPLLDHDALIAALLPGSYHLEVSSPGLERPLRTADHFRGARGEVVSLKARTADGGIDRRRVVLVGADDDGIEIDHDGARERVGYDDVVQARTVFEWGPAPKPSKARSRGSAKSGGKSGGRPPGATTPRSAPTVPATS